MSWTEDNQRHLTVSLARIRAALAAKLPPGNDEEVAPIEKDDSAGTFALDTLAAAFQLSPFERDVLLLCAGIELDSKFGALCAAAHGDPTRTHPTFSLALATLEAPHWSALTPGAALRRWRLIELGGGGLTSAPLRIDERILHYLAGINELDERLAGIVESVAAIEGDDPAAERIARAWSGVHEGPLPLVHIHGGDAESRRSAAATACGRLDLRLLAASPHAFPQRGADLDALARLLDRELFLAGAALLIDCENLELTDATRADALRFVIDRLRSPLLIASRERRRFSSRPSLAVEIPPATSDRQRRQWLEVLGDAGAGLDGELDAVIAHFALPPRLFPVVADDVRDSTPEEFAARLWDSCRAHSRGAMDDLAQRIETRAEWADLVLPDAARAALREIVTQVKHRGVVYDRWGFAARQRRGTGVTALFAGGSGTGKTLAAEVLANELKLDLYRIDLSQVVNKYIGETEKNLRRLFDAAEEGGAILLFDEADALFGKRSEVKDSHDRYANIEVSYLLQRMESYHGLAVLTTNHRQALDTSFLRRIRFVVEFPFPDARQRDEIWRRVFPPAMPREGVDAGKLARLAITGGNIHNIALNAAFLAAAAGTPLRMSHLLDASRREYAKLDRPLTDAEVAGWL
jgi:hypothetical protein